MKRAFFQLLPLLLVLSLLSSCRQPAPEPEPSGPIPSAQELAETVFPYSGCADSDHIEYLYAQDDPDQLTLYIANAYSLEEPWEDAAIIRATGASAFELSVLRLADEDAARRGEDSLKAYLHSREGDFAGYAPAQADMVADGVVLRGGTWLGLFICPSPEEARAAFDAALKGEALPERPTPAPTPAPEPTPEPATGMELLRDTLLDCCSDELAELEGYSVTMFGDSEDFPQMAADIYGVNADLVKDGFIIRDTGDAYFEVVVLRMADKDSAAEAYDVLGDYYRSLLHEVAFAPMPAPEQQALYEYFKSRFQCGTTDEFAYLLLCQNKSDAGRILTNTIWSQILRAERSQEQPQPTPTLQPVEIAEGVSFVEVPWPDAEGEPDPRHPGRIQYVQPNEEDMSVYDTSAIVTAWASGDPGRLSAYDRAIYDGAKEVLDDILRDGMSDFSKEAAIYEWVLQHVNYDWDHTDVMSETARDSYTPYGGLVNHKAVCLGYATTFQLLAELAGIECVTVVGAGRGSDHAWNQVRLNGEWYCADLTWDWSFWNDGRMNGREWRFFNTTSDYMARTGHQWDYDNVPEAVLEDHGRP